jgi:hypothetical protein
MDSIKRASQELQAVFFCDLLHSCQNGTARNPGTGEESSHPTAATNLGPRNHSKTGKVATQQLLQSVHALFDGPDLAE